MIRPRLTRTGARRSGDDYQDLVAAEAMLQILKAPSNYEWIKLEAREAGKLDDVLVLRRDGVVEATQVKYSTDSLRANDPWTWDRFLQKSTGGTSLLQDWFDSIKQLDEAFESTVPKLVSNRRAGADLHLDVNCRVDVARTDERILDEIRSQLGENAAEFLERFRFEVDEEDMGALDERLFRAYDRLDVTRHGWLNLKETIRAWIRCERLPTDGQIRITHIRNAGLWSELRPLPQNLEVPRDYTLPPDFHERFLQRIIDGSGSTIVLTAGPGMGKSTYISHLVQKLDDEGHPVIRHHYALQSTDSVSNRFESRRVAESLMAHMQSDLPGYIEESAIGNPDPRQLRGWLTEVGRKLRETGSQLVIAIDGLDHVWRERGSRAELINLFDQLIPVPEGTVLVVGTQPVADDQLPPALLRDASRKEWETLPSLDVMAVADWLRHHQDLLPASRDSGEDEYPHARIAELLFAKTAGHPLVLRYVIRHIARIGGQLTFDTVEAALDEPAASVDDYYHGLWVGLSEEAKDAIFLLSIARFPWPKDSLIDCLQLAAYETGSARAAQASVSHLLERNLLGFSAFHNSLIQFVTQLPEFVDRETTLRNAIIEWLANAAPDYWRRSHLWTASLAAGDDVPLLSGTDRRWAIESLALGHPTDEVARVLRSAAWQAIEVGDFPTYVDRGLLTDYVESIRHQHEATRWMFATQLVLNSDEYLKLRSTAENFHLSDPHLLELAKHFHAFGENEGVDECFNEMNRRNRREIGGFYASTNREDWYAYTVQLAGLNGTSPSRIVDFLQRCTSENVQIEVIENWIAGLRFAHDVNSAIQALKLDVGSEVRRSLSRYVAVQAVREQIVLSTNDCENMHPLYAALYGMAHSRENPGVSLNHPVVPEDEFSFDYAEFPMQIGRYIHDQFFCLVLQEIDSRGSTEDWRPADDIGWWLTSSLASLARVARTVAGLWENEGHIDATAVYDATSSLVRPPLVGDLAERRRSDGFEIALQTITEDLLALRGATGGEVRLSNQEAVSIAEHSFSGYRQVLTSIVEGSIDVSRSTIENVCDSIEAELATTIEPFSERAAFYAMLANVCAGHGMIEAAKRYLSDAAENLVGYGYHKDLSLWTALKAIETVTKDSSVEQSWLCDIAPAIAAIEEYTDGDKTRYLPAELGALLVRSDVDLAVKYVKSLTDDEKYGDVEDVMDSFVRDGDFTDPVVYSLVSTCIEPSSIRILEERASSGDEMAVEILRLSPGFSSDSLNDDASSDTDYRSLMDEPLDDGDLSGPDWHLNYPPADIDRLIERILPASQSQIAKQLASWLCLWAESGSGFEALHAAEQHYLVDDRLPVENQTVLAVKRIGGVSRSYEWLVRAQQSNYGWMPRWTSHEETEIRWSMFKNDFPEAWHDFLIRSIKPKRGHSHWFVGTFAHLIEYLVLLDRDEDARSVANQLVQAIRGLVSGQNLPLPSWADQG